MRNNKRTKTHSPLRIAALALILCVGLSLTACTNTNRLGYGFLDWYMFWKVERFVSLNKAQESATKAALKNFHEWHQKTQLPLYIEYLKSFKQRLNNTPLSADDIHAETDKIQNLLDLSLERLLPEAAAIIHTLNDEQVEEVLENIDEEREEYIDEYVDVSERKRLKQHSKDLTKALKALLGRINKQQKEDIAAWAKSLEPFETLSAEQQMQWKKDITTLLQKRDDQQVLLTGLKSLMFYRTDNWAPELEAILDRNQERTYAVIANMINNLTPKQQQKMQSVLTDYIEDCEHLLKKTL